MEERRARGRPREFDRARALDIALRIFWEKGYEPASVAELCAAMDINPPSLYAAFGNKAKLFLEAVRHYEDKYWRNPGRRLLEENDIYIAFANFFQEAAQILMSPDTPCGCMTVLSAVNICERETEIIDELRKIRMETKKLFAERMRAAIKAGQIPADTDVPTISGTLTALLEGLSLQAREGIFLSELKAMAAIAPRLLPQPIA